MEYLDWIIAEMTALLNGWKIPAEAAGIIAQVLMYIMLGYVAVTLLVFIGRAFKKVKRPITAIEKLTELVAVFVAAAATALIVLAVRYWPEILAGFKASDFWVSLGAWLDYQKYGVAIVSALFMLFILVNVYITAYKFSASLVRQETRENGAVLGWLLFVYDFFAGFFWLALGLTAYILLRQWL